ncbi:MAG: hypothetical protein RLY70_2442 [Planctomycetota bacterium]
MAQSFRFLVRATLAVAVLLVSPLVARAQAVAKPFMVVSINKLDDIFSDVGAVAAAAGQGDAANLWLGLAGVYTTGLDRTKPAGAYVSLGASGPQVVGFLPVKNLKQILANFEAQIGPAKDVGNGVLEVGANLPQPMYIKEQGGYAFIVQDPQSLQGVPADPGKIVQDLVAKYDIAVQVNIGNLPAEFRELAMSQLKMGFDGALQAQADNLPAEQRAITEQLGKASMKSIEDFMEQADQITFGIAVDGRTSGMTLESSVTAKAGSELAKQMESAYSVKSAFGGIGGRAPAALMSLTMALMPADIAQITAGMTTARQQAMQAIDDDAGVPNDKKEPLKAALGGILDVVQATMSAGKIDGAAAVNLLPGSIEVVGGAVVADGLKLEKSVKQIVEMVQDQPGFPQVQLDFAKQDGVNLHKIEIPAGEIDPNLGRLLGDRLEIILGFSRDRALLAVGRDGVSTMRQVTGASPNAGPSLPMQMRIALGQWMKMANAVESNPATQALSAAADQANGDDTVSMSIRPIERGSAYTLQVSGGVVKMAGTALKAMMLEAQ